MINIYNMLLRRGLTTSQRDFSVRWAGKSPSYFATTNGLSADAMVSVFRRLVEQRRWLLALRVARMVLFGRRDDHRAGGGGMIPWLEYGYVIASAPGQDEFPSPAAELLNGIEMQSRQVRVGMSRADAVLIACAGARGLGRTADDELYILSGVRGAFDGWMVNRYPETSYVWLDQWAIAFTNSAVKRSFDDHFGARVLRSVRLR